MTDPVAQVGRPLDRLDGTRKVSGTATYAAEVPIANVAYAVIVTSAATTGTIASIDTRAARATTGVIAILTPDNAPRLGKQDRSTGQRILQVLDDRRIRYADQPVAVVIAETLERAQHAASLVELRYDPGSTINGDLTRDLANAFAPHASTPMGEPDTTRGDVAAGRRAAVKAIDQTYTTPVETHNPLEPHATIAVWSGNDHLTVYDATQGIFVVRARLAALFAVPQENVRVIDPYVGGGFGCKGTPWSHVALAAMAARHVRRPVKLVLARPQMQSLVGHRPRTIQRIQLAADINGKLTAIRHEVTSETSRFDDFVEPCAVATRMLYACDNVATSHRLVRCDVPTPTFMRAPGEAPGTFALESAMDELAYSLFLDPLELRRRNHADHDFEKQQPFSSKSLLACYDRGAEQFAWKRRAPKVRAMRDGDMLVGLGMATAVYPSNQRPGSAIAKLLPGGNVLVQSGSQDLGTGTYTVMTQLAADALALPVERVAFELGDTTFPESGLSGGSSTAATTGSAVHRAAIALRDKLADLARADAGSPLYKRPREDLDVLDGAVVDRANPASRDPFETIRARAGLPEIAVTAKVEPDQKARGSHSLHAFGAIFVEVRVDPQLGMIRVSRALGAFAAGKILNSKTARSQFIGGMTFGIGMALFEETVRDPHTARAMTRDLSDYHVASHVDIPPIEVISIDEVDPYVNEIGVKGIGEIGNTGTAAAVANAVYHATGIRVRDLPITVDKLIAGGLA